MIRKRFLVFLFATLLLGCQSRPQNSAYVTFSSNPPGGMVNGVAMPVRQFWPASRLPNRFPATCAEVLTPLVVWPDGISQPSTTIRICGFESTYTINKPSTRPPPSTSSRYDTYQSKTYTNGDSYFGQLINGVPSGFGTYDFKKSGDKYEGYFFDGLRHGSGKYTFKNGSYFIGYYKNGKRDGTGKEYNSAGTIVLEGTWSDGVLLTPKSKEKALIENKPNSSAEQKCLASGLRTGSVDFNKCVKTLSK